MKLLKLLKFKKILALTMAMTIPSFCVHAYNVGDVIGTILSTDIVTYVDSKPATSYNISGRTAIITQELTNFGLDVMFDEATRVLTISKGSGIPSTFSVPLDKSDIPVGTPIGNVLYTDITTNFEGAPITSFNIGGLTCVYAEDFAKFYGTLAWDEEARTVNIAKPKIPEMENVKISSGRELGYSSNPLTLEDTIGRFGSVKKSHLVYKEDDTFYTVEAGDKINIEKYNADFNHVSSFTVSYELPIFGAFYNGKDYNYIAFGEENQAENNAKKVIKIVAYDKTFKKVKEYSVNNCATTVPFDASGCEITENDKYIILHTARSQYKDEYKESPQTQLTVIIDKKTSRVTNTLGKFQPNHTSHALNTLAIADGDIFVTADLSDAAPQRGIILRTLNSTGNVTSERNIYPISGKLGANSTGVMTGDLKLTKTGYLISMSAIDPTAALSYDNFSIEGAEYQNRNAYVIWAKKGSTEIKTTLLAEFHGTKSTASAPMLTPLSDGNYLALWAVFSNSPSSSGDLIGVFCAVIDENGNQIGTTKKLSDVRLSDSSPIVANNQLIWYVNTASGRTLYTIDLLQIQ